MNELYIKIRSYPGMKFCDVWLAERDGAASSWRLHGEMLKGDGEALAERLGLKVVNDEQPDFPKELFPEPV